MKDRLKEIIEVLKENNITHGINPVKLCKILEELGPTFIKIGQILCENTLKSLVGFRFIC